MHAVVTGGAGFIGSHLVERLLLDGHSVRVLDDLSTGTTANLTGRDVDVLEGSVTDRELVDEALDGAEVVFHQAALPSVGRSLEDPVATDKVNVGGTVNVLAGASRAGVRRLVYAGSSSAYGDTPELPKQEDMMPNPKSPYAAAKLAGEYYCRAFADSLSLSTVSLRYFNVFGPRQNPDGGYAAVVPAFITAQLDGRAPVIDGDGSQTRDFTFVDNVVEANLKAAAAPGLAGEVVNVATGDRTSVFDLQREIADIIGSSVEPRFGPTRAGDVKHSLADISRAAELIGYRPTVSRRIGLEQTIQWFESRRPQA